ncbi:hypothetical protein K525DRAFT_247921 [Schizophyllum commune Loenen D]|nr:hypothetical protein K525DRAFT_247921 [Schizophyllum commune Loenen D]
MPLYPAIALPLCMLSSLASGGVAGFNLRVVTRNVSIYGFFPAHASSWAEAYAFRANMPLNDLLEVKRRIFADPIILSRFDYWLYGACLGIALVLFRKAHVYPLPKGALRIFNECAIRLQLILEAAAYIGGSLGIYYFYAKQFRSANVRAALSERMQSIEQHRAWYTDFMLLGQDFGVAWRTSRRLAQYRSIGLLYEA